MVYTCLTHHTSYPAASSPTGGDVTRLVTMRVQEDPAWIKKISESKNPLLARQAKKKSKSGK